MWCRLLSPVCFSTSFSCRASSLSIAPRCTLQDNAHHRARQSRGRIKLKLERDGWGGPVGDDATSACVSDGPECCVREDRVAQRLSQAVVSRALDGGTVERPHRTRMKGGTYHRSMEFVRSYLSTEVTQTNMTREGCLADPESGGLLIQMAPACARACGLVRDIGCPRGRQASPRHPTTGNHAYCHTRTVVRSLHHTVKLLHTSSPQRWPSGFHISPSAKP